MLVFPNAKINIGLNILSRRRDGYHQIESLFYPIGLKDALEFVENGSNDLNLTLSGFPIDAQPENNIVLKAYQLLAKLVPLPGLDVHLHKAIPFGAGLGGGSADAAFFLKALNDYFDLKLTPEVLKQTAVKVGADCPFFIDNKPALATGIGEILSPCDCNLTGDTMLLVKPSFGVNTREAYADLIPAIPLNSLFVNLQARPEHWRSLIKNDFEPTVFRKYPEISIIKNALLEKGAFYASMSGSGSSVFGFFKNDPSLADFNFKEDYFFWKEQL